MFFLRTHLPSSHKSHSFFMKPTDLRSQASGVPQAIGAAVAAGAGGSKRSSKSLWRFEGLKCWEQSQLLKVMGFLELFCKKCMISWHFLIARLVFEVFPKLLVHCQVVFRTKEVGLNKYRKWKHHPDCCFCLVSSEVAVIWVYAGSSRVHGQRCFFPPLLGKRRLVMPWPNSKISWFLQRARYMIIALRLSNGKKSSFHLQKSCFPG